MENRYYRVLETFKAFQEDGDGWVIPPVRRQDDSPGLEIEAGTYMKRISFREREVLSGPHKGTRVLGFPPEEEELAQVEHLLSSGRVFLPRPRVFGWGGGGDVWRVIGHPTIPHPKQTQAQYFRLRTGETLEDFPVLATRSDQASWLKDRQAHWSPEGGWGKPVKPRADLDMVLRASTLDDLCQLIKVPEGDMEYSAYKYKCRQTTTHRWAAVVPLKYRGKIQPVRVQFVIESGPRSSRWKGRVKTKVELRPVE